MAGYRRFVSYIYRYEENKKAKNVGFARIEMRETHNKVDLWIKDGCREDLLTLEVSFLFRREGQTVKMPIGEFVLTSGDGNYRYDGSCELEKSEICGMLFLGREVPGRLFAIVWDEEDLEPDRIVLYEDRIRSREMPVADFRKENKDELPRMLWEDAVERVEPVRQEAGEEERQEPMDSPQNEVDRFPETDIQTVSEALLGHRGETVWEEYQERVPLSMTGPEDYMEVSWNSLSKRYTKVNPLATELAAECLKIRPGDIGRLPRAYWFFCNNSFLLKGYYQFQHLLLVRVPGKEGPTYYLCVPGRYYGNDKFTAEMFGFEHFFPADKGLRKDQNVSHGGRVPSGTFGYWGAEVETDYDTGRTLYERSVKTGEKGI